jgi:acetyl esterase
MHLINTRRARAAITVKRVATRLSGRVLPTLPAPVVTRLAGRLPVVDGNTLDPAIAAVLAGDRLTGGDGLAVADDVALTRLTTRQSALAFGGPVAPVAITDLSIPGPTGPIGARHYRPSGPAPAALLVYFHGGGFVFGDLDAFEPYCSQVCHGAGVHVLSVDYRLAPEHPAPAAVDDAFAAFRWAVDHAGDLGADPARIAVGGDSAGGMLAAVVAQLARDDGAQPCLQLLNYPVIDFRAATRSRTLFGSGFLLTSSDMNFFTTQYLDGSGLNPDDPRISPLAADLHGLPPALVVTAGFDPLRDEGNHYAKQLAAAGVPVDLREYGSMTHAFINLGGLGGDCRRAIDDSIEGLRSQLAPA